MLRLTQPIPMFTLVKREVLSTSRQLRPYLLVAASTAFIGGLVAYNWPEGSVANIYEYGNYARMLTLVVGQSLTWTSLLFIPMFAANSITVERREGTLDMLRLTTLTPRGVIVGKLLNSVAFVSFLTMANVPILATAYFLVGIDVLSIVVLIASLLLTTIAAALVGIHFSITATSLVRALLLSYVVLIGAKYILALPLAPLSLGMYGMIGFNTSSFMLQMSVVSILPDLVLIFLFYTSALYVWSRPLPSPRMDARKPIDDPQELWRRRTSFPFYLIDPLRRKKPIEDGRNPVFVRDIRWGAISRGAILARIFYLSFIGYVVMSLGAFFDYRNLFDLTAYLSAQLVLPIIVVPGLVASSITQEREWGNLDMLRMTLQKPRQIIVGKMLAGWLMASPLILSSLLLALMHFMFVLVRSTGNPYALGSMGGWLLLSILYVLIVCGVCISLGVTASVVMQRSSNALVLAYLLVGAVFAIIPATVAALEGWNWTGYFSIFAAMSTRDFSAQAVVMVVYTLLIAAGYFISIREFAKPRLLET